MTNGGFFEKRKTSPVTLGLILAGHVALLALIMLNPPAFGPRITYIDTIVTNIRDKVPPPDELPPPPKKTWQQTKPDAVDRLVDTNIGQGLTVAPLPPLPDPIPFNPVPSDPVITSATMDQTALGRFQPDYPSHLVRAGIEGLATVRVLIGSDGRVKAVDLVRATDPAFFDATKAQALRFWRFKPATRDGIATESWRTMTVKFKLES